MGDHERFVGEISVSIRNGVSIESFRYFFAYIEGGSELKIHLL